MRRAKRNTAPKKVVGYIRVSTAEQAQDGESLARQAATIRDYCTRNGFGEPEIVSDEGVSGSKRNRPGYGRILAMCRTGEIGRLVVYEKSRLHRDSVEANAFMEMTERAGIEIHEVHRGVVKRETANEKFSFNIEAALNQHYRDLISDKTCQAMEFKRAKGEKTGGTVPFGFELVDGVRLAPKPEEFETLRLMHSLRRQGLTLRAIVSTLQEKGIPTKTGRGLWSAKVVMRILDRTADLICQDGTLTIEQTDELLHEVTGALYQATESVCYPSSQAPQKRTA